MASGLFTLKQQLQGIIQKAWAGSQTTNAVEYLVVAGGGGGGFSGAGAGGLLQGIVNVSNGSSITVTVGAGGNGKSAGGSNDYTAGGNSVFGSITATGGGTGLYSITTYLSGGSGGGGNVNVSNIGNGVFGQGNAGGANFNGLNEASPYATGGGGGAGTVGLASGSASVAGNGGAGIASSINGTVTTYAGGGGGGVYSGGTGGTGGVGGGGAAGTNGTAGSANTGGGGGGSNSTSGNASGMGTGGAGGSGIVIISYPDIYNAPSALTGTYTASTSGSGSVLLNGSSQYITTPTSSNLALGTSNFSIEGWVYKTSASGSQTFIGVSVSSNLSPLFGQTSGGANTFGLYLSSNGTSFDIASNVSMGTVSLNTWNHLAVTRVGSTFTTYLNGAVVSTFTSSASIYQGANTFVIGASQTSFNYFNGYMSNVRIVIGASAYSAPFTPSTTPLTPITSTQLLLGTNSGAQFADSSTNSFASTVTGSPTWNQLSPFATGLGYKKRVYTWTASGTVTF